ncbi:MAG: FG-GAP repeat protein [Bacteroidota bacterium]
MRFLIFVAAISLWSCGQHEADKKEEVSNNDTSKTRPDTARTTPVAKENPLPTSSPDEVAVNEKLKASYGTKWHVLNDKEAKWMKDAFDYFIVPKRKKNPNYPYIAKGDFNGDGKQDMAAVVTDNNRENFRVAILLAPDKIQLWEEDIMIDAALSSTPRSTIEGMDGEKTKKVKLKGDGVNVEYFEKASFVLYWDKNSFKRIQTGD